MYTLLIADDEPLITDNLCDLFSGRTEPEFNVLRAYSGRQALDWAEKTRVDILLTDISMPDVTGLDVHRQLIRTWPECLVIYLTSFDEFDYVQQVIRNEGVDYILKTEGEQAVVSAVEKAVGRIEERQHNRRILNQARDSLNLALPVLQDRFIADLADAVESPSEDLALQLAGLGLPLSAGRPVLMLLGQPAETPAGPAMERTRQIYGARSAMAAFFSEFAVQACAVHERNLLIMLLQPKATMRDPGGEERNDEELEHGLALRVRGSLDKLQALCRESCGLNLSFAASGKPTHWEEVSAVYGALRMQLHKDSGKAGGGALYVGIGQNAQQQPHSLYHETRTIASRVSLLKIRLENGDCKGFMELFDAVTADVPTRNLQWEYYYRIAAMLVEYVNRWGDADCGLDNIARLIDRQANASWEEAAGLFRGIASKFFEKQQNESQSNENSIYKFIRDYTARNIGGDLSLTLFASLLNFHPFYLSKLFKKITGQTLSDYVSGVKLERAKELLGTGTMKVSDISLSLGFMTSSYFISFFRKHTGMSPLEYRAKEEMGA